VTPGNLELVQIIASWTVTLPATWAIVLFDERRLSGKALERAWPPSSRDAAVFALWNLGIQHFVVLLHFTRTRRTIDGFALGLRAFLVVGLLDDGSQLAAAAVIDWLGM